MSAPEESLNDQDPDYVSATSNDQTQQKIYEANARNTTARKITAIVEKEFSREINLKEKEILHIQEKLHKTLKIFHFLRYIIITNFYNHKRCQIPQAAETTKQTRIHPAIKSLLGKYPKSVCCTDLAVASTSTDPRFLYNDDSPTSTGIRITAISIPEIKKDADKYDITLQGEKRYLPDEESRPRKVPRYVPPKNTVPESACPSRGNSHKIRKRIIVGNISKWIPSDLREDTSSHKWTMYVRGDKDESANISTFVSKVRFFLHPSYHPNNIVEITSYPFHLSRRGWGEFPVRVQLHFKNFLDKPVDIIHYLKLDRTYTGLQTLGSETLANVWICRTESRNLEQNNSDESITEIGNNASVKIEPNDNPDFIHKQLANSIGETSRRVTSTSEEIRVKEEILDSNVYELSNPSLDLTLTEKSINMKVKSNVATTSSDKNGLNLEEINRCIEHDHNYLGRQYFNSHHSIAREGNVTIEHFPEGDCVLATISDSSAVGSNEEKLDNVAITSHRFNGDIQSSSICRLSTASNAARDDLQMTSVNTAFQRENDSQKRLVSFDTNKYLQARNSRNGDIFGISENISAKGTPMTINGSCKPCDRSAEDLQKTASCSKTCNSHLKPLQISIPPVNIFASSTNKHVLLLRDKKSIPVNLTSILPSKLSENSRKFIDSDVRLSRLGRNGNIAKLSVRGVSILKKPLIAKINARQEGTTVKNNNNNNNNNDKAATFALKGANSLLLNVNEAVPILKIADSRYNCGLAEATRGKQEMMPRVRSDDKTVVQRAKITLGKDKYKIQSKRELYETVLRSIDTANIVNTEALIRFIVRRLPIVTRDACDPEYKRLHPYACCSEKEYFTHNVGKRRALEWYRAKTIRCFLRMKLISADRLWSIKEIMLWARYHGYTPWNPNVLGVPEVASDMKKLPDDSTISIAIPSTYTEPIALQKWLQTYQQQPSHRPTDSYTEDEEIDIENVNTSSNSCRATVDRRKNSDYSIGSMPIPLELDENLLPFHNFVCNTARDIGIKIGPEEIVPGVLYCAASRVIMRVIECFVEDLTRSSLARAWERNNENGGPRVVTLNDVRNALVNREEFDIFTNEGLGSRQQLHTTELSNL